MPDATPPPAVTAPATPSPSALPSAPPLTATDSVTMPSSIQAPPVNPGGQLASTPPVTPRAPESLTAPSDWTAHLSAEQRGWIQAKGVTDPGQLADMWKGMEKVVGTPKEQLAIIPKDIKGLADYRDTLTRLGTPDKPEGYALQPDTANGGTPEFTAEVSKIFHEAGLTKHQADIVSGKWNQFQAAAVAQQNATYEAKVVAEKQALSAEWGVAHDQNIAIAKRAAATFGVKPEVVAALEKSGSYADVMKFFLNVGARMGEAKFVAGNPGVGLMTPEQASAEKAQLMADQVWRNSYLQGDQAKVKKMSQLIAAEMGIEI